jgi:hypothetical protein
MFQALMMRSMYDNDYGKAVRKTFLAERVSMNMVMVGMIPVMVVLMHHLEYGDDPLHPLFWFIMGWPRPPAASPPTDQLLAGAQQAEARLHDPPGEGRGGARHGRHGRRPTRGPMPEGHMQHEMGQISTAKATLVIAMTFATLLLAAWLTSAFLAPISFRS